MTIRVSDITAVDWSPQQGNFGEVVTDILDIEQCIGIILTTPRGSDPHRPLFGCDAWRWIDKPSAIAIPNIILEAVDSLEMWEPRIELVGVTARLEAIGWIAFTVEWRLKGENRRIKTEVHVGQSIA